MLQLQSNVLCTSAVRDMDKNNMPKKREYTYGYECVAG